MPASPVDQFLDATRLVLDAEMRYVPSFRGGSFKRCLARLDLGFGIRGGVGRYAAHEFRVGGHRGGDVHVHTKGSEIGEQGVVGCEGVGVPCCVSARPVTSAVSAAVIEPRGKVLRGDE